MQDGELVAIVGADAERRHVAHLHRHHRLELLGRVHLQDPRRARNMSRAAWHFTSTSQSSFVLQGGPTDCTLGFVDIKLSLKIYVLL